MDATVKLDSGKRDVLKIIATVEKRDIKTILGELVDDYIERNKETLEILSRPDWVEAIEEGVAAADRGETISWRKKKAAKAGK